MTVRELINLLSKENPDKHVCYEYTEPYDDDPETRVDAITGIMHSTDKKVVLEGFTYSYYPTKDKINGS